MKKGVQCGGEGRKGWGVVRRKESVGCGGGEGRGGVGWGGRSNSVGNVGGRTSGLVA